MRSAFTLIELIVSIVVIGIALMTLPLMIEQSAKTNEVANLARSYFNAQVLLQTIASMPWDKQIVIKSTDNNGSLFLDVVNGDKALDRTDNNTTKRIGSFEASEEMRHFYPSNTFASQIPSSSTTYNAIEDYNNYKTQVGNTSFSVAVAYVDDGKNNNSSHETATWNLNSGNSSQTQSTNLKRITLTLTNTTGANKTTANLGYFSSNIGAQITQLK
jgi:prepilin-type N-terminal cleavage/methylation domain-containing protein